MPRLIAIYFNVNKLLDTLRFSQYMSSGVEANETTQFFGLKIDDREDFGGSNPHCSEECLKKMECN